jgi:hypothetical protein
MTKDERLKQKIAKMRMKVENSEAKISKAIGDSTLLRDRMWKTCPHKWERILDKDPRTTVIWSTCAVCGVTMRATKEEIYMESL